MLFLFMTCHVMSTQIQKSRVKSHFDLFLADGSGIIQYQTGQLVGDVVQIHFFLEMLGIEEGGKEMGLFVSGCGLHFPQDGHDGEFQTGIEIVAGNVLVIPSIGRGGDHPIVGFVLQAGIALGGFGLVGDAFSDLVVEFNRVLVKDSADAVGLHTDPSSQHHVKEGPQLAIHVTCSLRFGG